MFSALAMLPKAMLCILALTQLVAAVPKEDRFTLTPSTPEDHVLAKRAVQMELWDPKKEGNNKDIFYGLETRTSDRHNHPTYQKKLALSGLLTDASIAEAAYNNIKDKVRQTPTILVAVLHVPSGSGKGLYLSTVPDGPGLGYLKTHKAHAPAWYHAVGNRVPNVLHAEDGAEMYYEMHNPETNAEFTYPEGTVMTVFGKINNSQPDIQRACSDVLRGAPNPTCAQVKTALHIA